MERTTPTSNWAVIRTGEEHERARCLLQIALLKASGATVHKAALELISEMASGRNGEFQRALELVQPSIAA